MLFFSILSFFFLSPFTSAVAAHFFVPPKPVYIPAPEPTIKTIDENGARILVIADADASDQAPSYDRCCVRESCVIFYYRSMQSGMRLDTREFNRKKETFTFIHIAPGVFFTEAQELKQVEVLLADGGQILYCASFAAFRSLPARDEGTRLLYPIVANTRQKLLRALKRAHAEHHSNFLIFFEPKTL